MKKLLLPLLLVCGFAQAQIVTFSDPLFKSRLLDASPDNLIAYGNGGYIKIDANDDGDIQLSEAQAVDSLNIPYSHVVNLGGIEAFNSLKKLDCSRNELTNLNTALLPNLYTLICGGNQLQTLNLSPLTQLKELVCDYNQLTVLNLVGLNALEFLNCEHNQLATIDISGLPALEFVNCSNGGTLTNINIGNAPSLESFICGGALNLQAIDFTGAPNMKYIYCSYNGLTSLNVAGLSQLIDLSCNENNLSALNLSGLTSLKDLRFSNNQFTSIDLSQLPQLERLICYQNQLTALDFSMLPNLQAIYCSSNQLTTFDVSGLGNLLEIGVSENPLTTLTLGNLPLMRTLLCGQNQLTSLDLSGMPLLSYLYCGDNQLTTIDVSGLSNLTNLYCDHNQLTTLDLSANMSLNFVNFLSNPLETVYMKNGGFQQYPGSIEGGTGPFDIANTPLQYICGDDFELNYWNSIFGNTLQATSYCPFTGGAHNTITGQITFDANNNGCDASDSKLQNVRIDITDGVNNGATFSNASGNYNFYVQQPQITLTPVIENPSYFTISPPTATLNFPIIDSSTQPQSFCIIPNGVHNDVEITLIPLTNARPGFDAVYELIYRNKGNQQLSGTVSMAFDDAVLDLVSANPGTNAQSNGLLTWNYSDLLPFETRKITVIMNLNSPMENPPLNDGDILHLNANVNPIGTDETPNDNTFNVQQRIVNSFDPNNKICLEGNQIAPNKIGDYLHYTINFENTGSAAAERIVVKDVIDTTKFDISTLQVISSSHTATTRITGSKVEFIFESINLGAEEHGNVTFKIKTKGNLTIGDSVSNKADIYFDYNFPIETNNETSVFQLLANQTFQADASVMISPNPASDLISVKANATIKSVALFDVQGRIVSANTVGAATSKVDISRLSKGIYLMKVDTDKGARTQKIIKE